MDLSENEIKRALKLSLSDGAFATVMGSLCGGIFLIGFALNVLEASTFQVGILAALPLSANIAQLIGSIIIERFGRRRKFCIFWVTLARCFWIPILMVPFSLFPLAESWKIWILIAMVGLASVHGSMSGVAWLGWMSDLIPSDSRGRFFAKRNIICASTGMVATLLGGFLLNYREKIYGKSDPTSYVILFAVGLGFGLISSYFLSRVPDPTSDSENAHGQKISLSRVIAPLSDQNFRKLLFYVGSFMFVTQMAGPFYSVYMIENLEVDFSTITLLITIATLSSLFMLRIWGPISDQLGNKPILTVAGCAHAMIPLVWVVAQDQIHEQALIVAHVLSGMFYAAITLAHINILIKLAPAEGRSFYIASFNTIIGLSVAFAPIVGGTLLEIFSSFHFSIGKWNLNNLHLLFLLSGLLQIFVLGFLARIHETGSSPSRTVLMQLRNDLDPQTGITSATDFITIRANKTSHVVRKVDTTTDDWASHCETYMAKAIDSLLLRIRKPLRFILDDQESPS